MQECTRETFEKGTLTGSLLVDLAGAIVLLVFVHGVDGGDGRHRLGDEVLDGGQNGAGVRRELRPGDDWPRRMRVRLVRVAAAAPYLGLVIVKSGHVT